MNMIIVQLFVYGKRILTILVKGPFISPFMIHCYSGAIRALRPRRLAGVNRKGPAISRISPWMMMQSWVLP